MVLEGRKIESFQSREAILKKSSSQYGVSVSIESVFFNLSPSLATAEKQGTGLKFSIENEISNQELIFQARMFFSCVGEWFSPAFERELLFYLISGLSDLTEITLPCRAAPVARPPSH